MMRGNFTGEYCFKDNYGGVVIKKAFLHAKRWYVYLNEKVNLIKDKFLVEVVDSDVKNFLWEVVDNHVVEEENDHEEIGYGFFILFCLKNLKRGLAENG